MSDIHSLVNIASRDFKADPFPYYARLRKDHPVGRARLGRRQEVWLITRYDDVVAALKDPRLVKDRALVYSGERAEPGPWIPGFARPLLRNMLDLDELDHTRLRALVQKAFTPGRVEQLRPSIQAIAEQLLDQVQGRGSFDLVKDYALPLPLTVIVQLLGIPSHDRERFHRWSRAIVRTPTPINMLRALPSLAVFLRYLRKLFRERRDHPRDDLLTALVQAEEAGDRLSEDELLAMAFLLLVAGHETTVNLIASGTLALLQNPHQLEALRKNPELIRTAVEELLRFVSPLETATERFAREELIIAGTTIPRGAMVLAVLASANRDAEQFERPDILDIAREKNKHLAFGHGSHFCLGAPLARLEGQIAINTLLRRMPGLRLLGPTEKLRWRPTPILRGLEALPVGF